ncbi:hypothetical protein [Halorussus aquaticus]|uniref:Uncharacterized protein n=1 Tax=Halorussus aquaticus TaxID=2953748 RepID=A0ABD5Q008_9EURY|nr:hypothetical protein [Halorussus aquaticus]
MVDRRQVELIGVLVFYFAIYTAVLGPAIGGATGFEKSALDLSGDRGAALLRMFTSVRGWILVLGFGPVVYGYMLTRARIAGVGPREMWGR